MSGCSLPYHLRTNKAIDRKIFFDILGHLSSFLPNKIQKYKYFSMGGPMLEDHHLLHHELGMTKLYSIERDEAALSRQQYNKPFGCISCTGSSTREFINNFNENDPVIVWLDYTDTKWSAQFSECADLLNNFKEFDILKVTFNANPEVLKKGTEKSQLSVFKNKANHPLLSENLIENDVQTMRGFAKTILDVFKSISEDVLSGDGLFFYPLIQFRYIDNRHQMLTVAGMVLSEDDPFPEKMLHNLQLIQWPYLYTKWGDIQEINVPDLTLKERQVLNQLLPMDPSDIQLDELPFKFHKNDERATKMVENYVKYYRYIPNFQRVVT